MNVTFRPIEEWPGREALRSPASKERSRFESTWSQTLDILTYELGRLGARAVVVRLALSDRDIRRDGWPRANSRPDHPGVVVEWQIGETWYFRANDKYDDWQDNIRGIVLTLKSLRDVERWGAVSGEQYEGMRLEIEPPGSEAGSSGSRALAVLERHAGLSLVEGLDVKRLYKMAARKAHPDAGGSDAAFNEVQEAWRVLGKAPSGAGS